jgi:TolB-like protein
MTVARISVALVCAALAACAGTAPKSASRTPHIAVLPFESVGPGEESGRVITRLFQNLLADEHNVHLADAGTVEDALIRLRLRIPVLATREQLDSLHTAIGCDYVLSGSVLTYGTREHPYAGKVGVVSMTVQVVRLDDGKLVWGKTASKQGSDGQWLFGLGTQHDPAVLAESMCRNLISDIPWNRLGQ